MMGITLGVMDVVKAKVVFTCFDTYTVCHTCVRAYVRGYEKMIGGIWAVWVLLLLLLLSVASDRIGSCRIML